MGQLENAQINYFFQKNVTLESAEWRLNSWNKYFKGVTLDDYNDPLIKRQVKILYKIGSVALEKSKLIEVLIYIIYNKERKN